ncbi:hypothetical protein V2J09_020064 [Rumex salicifolius]
MAQLMMLRMVVLVLIKCLNKISTPSSTLFMEISIFSNPLLTSSECKATLEAPNPTRNDSVSCWFATRLDFNNLDTNDSFVALEPVLATRMDSSTLQVTIWHSFNLLMTSPTSMLISLSIFFKSFNVLETALMTIFLDFKYFATSIATSS